MTKTCFFALGGGSDFYSACLLALASDTEDIVLTALAPIEGDEGLDVKTSVLKYTGQPYGSGTNQNPDYQCFSPLETYSEWPVFKDSRRTNSFATLVPQKKFSEQRAACVSALRRLLGPDPKIVAVDTGGDCMRGLVSGMGDRDLSYLYGGTLDSRDTDSIEIIRCLTKQSLSVYVFGPGADGETTDGGLSHAWDLLRGDSSLLVRLVKAGRMDEFGDQIRSIERWQLPVEGSTLDNIRRAMESPAEMQIEVRRRGAVIDFLRASHLSSYWLIEVAYTVNN